MHEHVTIFFILIVKQVIQVNIRSRLPIRNILGRVLFLNPVSLAVLAIDCGQFGKVAENGLTVVKTLADGIVMHLQNLKFWQTLQQFYVANLLDFVTVKRQEVYLRCMNQFSEIITIQPTSKYKYSLSDSSSTINFRSCGKFYKLFSLQSFKVRYSRFMQHSSNILILGVMFFMSMPSRQS